MEINELLNYIESNCPEYEINYVAAPEKWEFDFEIEVKNTLKPVTITMPRLTLTLKDTINGKHYSLIYATYAHMRNYWYIPKNADGSLLQEVQCRPDECEDLLHVFDVCYKTAQKVRADIESKSFVEDEKKLLELGMTNISSSNCIKYQLTDGFPDKKEIGITLLEQSVVNQTISFYKFYVYDRQSHRMEVNRSYYDSFEEMIADITKE